MMTQQDALFALNAQQSSTGLLPAQGLRQLISRKVVRSLDGDITDDQIQPASLDLRLGRTVYRVRASFLPSTSTRIEAMLGTPSARKIDCSSGALLERGGVYIIPLQERVDFTKRMFGFANPKSSAGRLGILARLIPDADVGRFNEIPEGYKGALYAEVSPLTFGVVVRPGSKLLQMRVRLGSPPATDSGIRRLHETSHLVDGTDIDVDGGLAIRVDLKGSSSELIGYKSKPCTMPVDVDVEGEYNIGDFWDEIRRNRSNTLILDTYSSYILASKELVSVPPDHAAEMIPFNHVHGEFRAHYAGFFDPGFGYPDGARAVFEVRSYGVPFELRDGQVAARLVYERMTDKTNRLYGHDGKAHYQGQGLALSKHFRSQPES